MPSLEWSESLGRKIRTDPPDQLGVPTWDLVKEAVREGRVDDALELLDYGCEIDKMLLDTLISYLDDALTFMAQTMGEDAAFEFVRRRYAPRVADMLAKAPDALSAMQREVENQRGHFAEIVVTEDDEKYTVTLDPCGTGGRLRRTKDVARTQEPHPWSWGKSGVPYYCAHCTMMWEILPIEERGYPISVFLPPEQDQDACVHLYYKRPEDIPEKYFDRVGKRKNLGLTPTARPVEEGEPA
jgi:hypothetical protein